MNCKIIREGNAFYETDEQCMQKKERKSSNRNYSDSFKNTASQKQNNMFNYKYPAR